MKKKSYECHAHELVDNTILSQVISQNQQKTSFMYRRVKQSGSNWRIDMCLKHTWVT